MDPCPETPEHLRPLEEGWQSKVAAFADQIMSSLHIETG